MQLKIVVNDIGVPVNVVQGMKGEIIDQNVTRPKIKCAPGASGRGRKTIGGIDADCSDELSQIGGPCGAGHVGDGQWQGTRGVAVDRNPHQINA
ncbi:MAG: hypothetical protein ACD_62C00441G0001 [uncultured bacterium]|nr:MAG: hypothetical protein ACD_62C00441G0001 [uncultured bacterium]